VTFQSNHQRGIAMTSAFACAGLLATVAIVSIAPVEKLRAQGCEPIRFTTPVNLGGKGEAYQREQQWRVTLAYRGLRSNEWFIGSTESSARGPGGKSPVFNINTFVGDVAYAPTDRFLLHLSVPVLTGSVSATRADGLIHAQSASGIGDVSLLGETWLLAPKTHDLGNISLGLGVKAPTGSHTSPSTVWTATSTVPFPADQTVQRGDGGWAILTSAQAFHQVGKYVYLYVNSSYTISPKAKSDVVFAPGSTLHWSVPDTYSASAGAAFSVLPDQGLSLSVGGRLDGIPLRDLFGGGDDDTVKRTSRVAFVDPGVNWSHGKDSFTISVPVRVYVNRFKSLYEQKTNGLNAGGFAKYLVFASYSHRL
jgi:hypothetical protein